MEITPEFEEACQDYQRVAEAIQYIEENAQRQPELAEIAAALGLSEYHFQRIFTRWAGVSPKRFLQYLTKERAKQLLAEERSLLDVSYEIGLSGPGRLYDLFVHCEAVTPGEYKQRGEGLTIRYGVHPSPFGECLLGFTSRGITNLIFLDRGERDGAAQQLAAQWPRANLVADQEATQRYVTQVFRDDQQAVSEQMQLHLVGTNFQIKVWEALLSIPSGSLVCYQDLAMYIGLPHASRAVGMALSKNPIPVIIPCHRVIQSSGEWGGYRYGTTRKLALLGWEIAHTDAERIGFR